MNDTQIIASKTSRRSFLKVVGTGVALHSTAASYTRILGANDRVRVGAIGFSERFRDALFPGAHRSRVQPFRRAVHDDCRDSVRRASHVR
jgi:hypothetical protein